MGSAVKSRTKIGADGLVVTLATSPQLGQAAALPSNEK